MEDRKISDAERINLIRKVANSEGLFGILKAVESEFNIVIPELTKDLHEDKKVEQLNNNQDTVVLNEPLKEPVLEEKFTQPSIITIPKEASIYREEAKPLVAQDMLEHPAAQNKETPVQVAPVIPSMTETYEEEPLEEHPKVLEKTKNNPWSGIETVLPGQLKL